MVINGKNYLEKMEVETLVDCNIFAGVDELLISWIIGRLENEDIGAKLNGKTIPELCVERRKQHFGKNFRNEYFILQNAFDMIAEGKYQPVSGIKNLVKSQLYERQAVANKISNFERRLPAEQKNMVLSTMKDPYMFDFIDYTEEMLETDIENELVKNVTSLLMELGTGFAFMGQQYHLEVGEKDFYIDLLFYNTKLRCYVAIDLKTGEFKPEQAGKMNFYLSALDDLVKAPEDNPSVGLILCRDENRTIAEYALRDMSKPIGVSEYHLCTDLPLDLKNALPAVEDIRSRIDMKK